MKELLIPERKSVFLKPPSLNMPPKFEKRSIYLEVSFRGTHYSARVREPLPETQSKVGTLHIISELSSLSYVSILTLLEFEP